MKSGSISANLRVCVVGAGKMGADHIERLSRRIVGAEVAVVVDADVSRAKKAVEATPSAAALPDIGQALDRKDVDAVVIATPGFLHKEMLLQVRERGLSILCEKPLTRTRRLPGKSWKPSSDWERSVSRLVSCDVSIPNTGACES
jgi:myo-inositol 2-dehydrogenase/D-chiro-inositol 1-dehydrogenase